MKLDRRFLLRGTCQGALAVVGMPFLDCFLDNKGRALAATGRPLPTRFNTFFFGLGLTKQLWIPKVGGKDYEMTGQLKPLEPYRSKLYVFSGLRVPLDDNPNYQHWSGAAAAATGISPTKQSEFDSKTIDQQVADVISHGTRYKSVAAAAAGVKQSYSSLGGAAPCRRKPRRCLSIPACSDLASRIVKGDWKPDPQVMVQQSVLSVVSEDRKRAMQIQRHRQGPDGPVLHLGARGRTADGGPASAAGDPGRVTIPDAPGEMTVNNALPNLRKTVPLIAKLGALALATDPDLQFLGLEPGSQIFVPGDTLGYHQSTHEEPIDPVLAYQPRVSQYNIDNMELFVTFLKEMDAIPEGDGTLLDHSLFLPSPTRASPRFTVDGLPIFVAGGASGRMKAGHHVAGDSSPVSRVGLTIQKAMGVSLDVWGKGSMEIRQPYTDLLA